MDFFNDLLMLGLLVVCVIIIVVFMKDFMILGRKREKEEQVRGARVLYTLYAVGGEKGDQKTELVPPQEVDLTQLPVQFGSSSSSDIVIRGADAGMDPAALYWFCLVMADSQLTARAGRKNGSGGQNLQIYVGGQRQMPQMSCPLESGRSLELRSGSYAVVLKLV